MAEARPGGIPEIHVMPMIPESDSFTQTSESDSASLIPDGSMPISSKNPEAKVGHARRNSTGNVDIPYARVTILSRYLSGSTGSCHDNCKYGKKQDAETKTTSPRPKSTQQMQRRGQIRQDMENPESPGVRKKNAPSSGVTPQKTDIPAPGKRESFKKLGLSRHLSFPTKAADVPAIHVIHMNPKLPRSKPSSPSIRGSSTSKEDGVIQDNKKTGMLPAKSPKASGKKKKGLTRTISMSAINSVKKALMRPLISLSHKRSTKRVSSINPERFKKLEGISCLRIKSDHGKSGQPSTEDVPEKTLHVIDESHSERRNSKSQNEDDIHGFQLDSPSTKKIYKNSQHRNQATEQPPSSDKKNFNSSKERIRARRSSVSSVASLESSKSIDDRKSETFSIENKTRNAKAEHKIMRRKDGVTNSKHQDIPEKRISFRTGRVIELQSDMKTSRRLKFKRRTLSDIPVSKVDSTKELRSTSFDAIDTNTAEIETAEKVVLKHSDVEEKKDVQYLLNNVIEETASKLVETRKSKVKALVGAFETVISLQDSKPSSSVAA